MKNLILISLLLCSTIVVTNAQPKTHNLGIRLGGSSGIDYKYFCNNRIALNTLLVFQHGGMRITELVQVYRPILMNKTSQLFLFSGGGLHVGYVSDVQHHHYKDEPTHYHTTVKTKPAVGIDGVIGLEYRFTKAPISVGINYKPSFELLNPKHYWWGAGDFGVTAHYNF